MVFDPLNLLLLAIAVVVFWRLKSLLGSRTGNERPPPKPSSHPGSREAASDAKPESGNVLRFPRDDQPAQPAASGEPAEQEPIWSGFAEAGSPVAEGLLAIVAGDRNFKPKSFMDGAKAAYEMIIEAFAKGDKSSLKSLLSKDVLEEFSHAIDSRQASGQKVDTQFVGIDRSTIVAAAAMGRKASITVKFVSELISATHDREGKLIDGDPKLIRETTDVWTFERDMNSRDPNWKLVSTEEPN